MSDKFLSSASFIAGKKDVWMSREGLEVTVSIDKRDTGLKMVLDDKVTKKSFLKVNQSNLQSCLSDKL